PCASGARLRTAAVCPAVGWRRQTGGARMADRLPRRSRPHTSRHDIVGDEPFALLLPDMLHHGARPCLAEMIEAYERHGGNHIAVSPVPDEDRKSTRLTPVTVKSRMPSSA